jgi:hypothetical protein
LIYLFKKLWESACPEKNARIPMRKNFLYIILKINRKTYQKVLKQFSCLTKRNSINAAKTDIFEK